MEDYSEPRPPHACVHTHANTHILEYHVHMKTEKEKCTTAMALLFSSLP